MTKIKTTLLFLFVSSLFTACMQPPDINKDFGPEVGATEIKQALDSVQAEATAHSVANIQVGEFAYIEKTNQIENLYPIVFRQRADTVMNRTEDSNKVSFVINREVRELETSTGNMKPSKSQYTACLEKAQGACSDAAAVLSTAVNSFSLVNKNINIYSGTTDDKPSPDYGVTSNTLGELNAKALITRTANDASSTEIHWTYHNLKKVYSTMSTPPLVAIRPDCGGRPGDCQIPMKTIQISFDEVDWTSEVNPVKYSYSLVFSQEAPFFASQILSCGSTTIPYKNQRIALMQCETVKDFTYGKP